MQSAVYRLEARVAQRREILSCKGGDNSCTLYPKRVALNEKREGVTLVVWVLHTATVQRTARRKDVCKAMDVVRGIWGWAPCLEPLQLPTVD